MLTLAQASAEVDRLDKEYQDKHPHTFVPIGPGIRRLVVALRAYEFNTTSSCQGSNKPGDIQLYPYVVICAPWYDNGDIQVEWAPLIIEWEKQVAQLKSLVEEFYIPNPRPPYPLHVRTTSFGRVSLGPIVPGVWYQTYLTLARHKTRQAFLDEQRAEMRQFARYLESRM